MPEPLQAPKTAATSTRQILDAIKGLHARLDGLEARIDQVVANQARQTEILAAECARFTNALKDDLFRVYDDLDHDGGVNLPFGPVGANGVELVGDRLRTHRRARLPGKFVRAALGLEDTLWALAADQTIWRWEARTGTWAMMPGALTCITAPTPDIVWGTAYDGSIWRWDGAGWQQVAGNLVWISAAADGTVVGCAGDQSIWRLIGPNSWEQLPGRLVRIAVRSASEMIGINAGDGIFVWGGTDWIQAAGAACEAAVGEAWTGAPLYYVVNRESKLFTSAEPVPQSWSVREKMVDGIAAAGPRLLTKWGDALWVEPEI
jgi:hypothetical protein